MQIKEIVQLLEEYAPLRIQENYDNCGLICGNKNDEVENILTTLNITEEVLEEAINKKCNLIIAHHPIVFFGMKKFSGESYVERILIKAIKNHISIYAMHTPTNKFVG